MIVRIHFTWPDGSEDSIVLSGDSVDEIRAKADKELASRHGANAWSEVLNDEGQP